MSDVKYWNITNTPAEELMSRREKVLNKIAADKVKGMIFFNAKAIRYLSRGCFTPTERPIGLALRADGYMALMVPRLELEYADEITVNVDKIITYDEYPGERNPMYNFCDLLKELGMAEGPVAADMPRYPDYYGARCPALTSILPSLELKMHPHLVEGLMMYKSEYDLKGIRESARWGNLAHSLMQKYTTVGAREIAVSERAGKEASEAMLECLGPDFFPATFGLGNAHAFAIYRGQIGKNSYFPHARTNNAMFAKGDTLVTAGGAYLLEYNSELERTMFMDEPSTEQLTFFNHAAAVQNAAISAIKPGVECAKVDEEVKRYFKENGLMEYWRHHTGHALGFDIHEAPFFDVHDHSIIEPGMVFSVEPGLYVEGLGGFRLSDTVAIHEGGIEMISYYPREVDKLICW